MLKSMWKTIVKNILGTMWIKMNSNRLFFCLYLSHPAATNLINNQYIEHGTY